MANFSTKTHGPAADAPSVTNLVAHCNVCGIQWQVLSENLDDTKGCGFCGASEDAVTVTSEAPNDYGAVVK